MIEMPPVGDETLRRIMDRRAKEDPGHVLLKFQDRDHTFGAIDAQVNRVANALLARGLQPGDRVALMLPSHPDHLVAILALAKVGLVRVPINTSFKGASLAHPFEAFAPRALIADAAHAEVLAEALPAGAVEMLFWRGGAQDGFAALLAHADSAPPAVEPGPDDIIALTPSSGTTGAPKGVNKSDRTLRAGPMGTLRLTGAQPGDVFLLWESLHHGAGVAVCIAAILQKLTLAMVEKFSASQFWEQCRRNGVTHIHYLGGVLPMLLKQPPKDNDRDHTVRIAWGGGCPPEVWDVFSERFGVEMREGYGLSEMITFVTVNPQGPKFSIGQPLSYFDLQLTDDEGNEVPVGQPGEILRALARAGPAVPGLLPQRGRHRGRAARRVVLQRRPGAARRGGVLLLCGPQEGHGAPARHQHLGLGGRARDRRAPRRRRMRGGRRAQRTGR
ncbi:AMP-binding protein [Ottowia sp.]|uniref:AMP-binding protein n=1 Tax=Ottowia sp. TaxID=1898956 RepID=UPI0039E5506E